MQLINIGIWARVGLACTLVATSSLVGAMGLRSFVALPVDSGGSVVRLTLESADEADSDTLIASLAYGIEATQTLLLSLPYRIEPRESDRRGDFSILFRQIIHQQDYLSGTNRLGVLAGIIMPTKAEHELDYQLGLVFTHFKNRDEIDGDFIYRFSYGEWFDSARYDLSWQYRLSPEKRPTWGLVPELNTVLELNGRWQEGGEVVHQMTAGLQWIHPQLVLEGGIAQDFSNGSEKRLLLSTRFHF